MSYYNKYLKYKSKYINLKKIIGGGNNLEINIDNISINGVKIVEIDNTIAAIIIDYPKYDPNIIDDALASININDAHNNKWVDCHAKCYTKLKHLIDQEIATTHYILMSIINSIIKVGGDSYFSLKWNTNDSPVGTWSLDKNHIKLILDGNEETRLLMGFGPSASGKTYWVRNLIRELSKNNFPKLFISIDGGIYRETSIIYNKIKDIALEKKVSGLSNLVAASIGKKSLFNAKQIKREIINYLKNINKQHISLYVPDTLSECFPFECNLNKLLKNYFEITNDKEQWSAAFIWQHKTHEKCTFQNKCVGCKEAGTEREKTEGKKYSGTMWGFSDYIGRKYMAMAPGYKISIHNCGKSDCISDICEYDCISNACQIFIENDDIIKYNCQCCQLKHPGFLNYIGALFS